MYINQIFPNIINFDGYDTYTSLKEANFSDKFDNQKLTIFGYNIHSNSYNFDNDPDNNKILFTNKFYYYKTNRKNNKNLRYIPYFSISEISSFPMIDDDSTINIMFGELYLRYLYMLDEEMLNELNTIYDTICVNDACIGNNRKIATDIIFNKIKLDSSVFFPASKLLTLHVDKKHIYEHFLFHPLGEYNDNFTMWSAALVRCRNIVYDMLNDNHKRFMDELLFFYKDCVINSTLKKRFNIIKFDTKKIYFQTNHLYFKALKILDNFNNNYFINCNELDEIKNTLERI